MNDVLWDWDHQNDRVVWNDALRTTYGYDELETTKAWWADRVHPDDRDAVAAHLDDVLRSGRSWYATYRFARADGSWADVLDRGTVVRSAYGRVTRMVGAMVDTTPLREVQRALVLREAQLRTILDAVADALEARGVPILFLTGYGAAPGGRPNAALLGKPFATRALQLAVRALVQP